MTPEATLIAVLVSFGIYALGLIAYRGIEAVFRHFGNGNGGRIGNGERIGDGGKHE